MPLRVNILVAGVQPEGMAETFTTQGGATVHEPGAVYCTVAWLQAVPENVAVTVRVMPSEVNPAMLKLKVVLLAGMLPVTVWIPFVIVTDVT